MERTRAVVGKAHIYWSLVQVWTLSVSLVETYASDSWVHRVPVASLRK